MKKPTVTSCNFANTPKTVLILLTEVKMFLIMSYKSPPVLVATQSKAYVCGCLPAETEDLNPAGGMDVFLF